MQENEMKMAGVEVINESRAAESAEVVELQTLAHLFQGVLEPLAKSQEIAAIEGTKRAEILARIAHRGLMYFFSVAFIILFLAGAALFLGKDQLAEKIIFGVITFIGGLGIGRSMPKNG